MYTKYTIIAIGISDYRYYKLQQIHDLPAAQMDAVNFARALSLWSKLDKHTEIHLLLNSDATTTKLIQLINSLIKKHYDFDHKLIFYFAGHGIRQITKDKNSSSLLFFDKAMELENVLKKIFKIPSKEYFVFIDACNLRINVLHNPLVIMEKIKTTRSFGLFCVFAAGIDNSYENLDEKYGYFTKNLIQIIDNIKENNFKDCNLLVKRLAATLRKNLLPTPEYYQVGKYGIWFIPETTITYSESNSLINRGYLLTDFHSILINANKRFFILQGESGVGKTTFMRSLNNQSIKFLYCDISNITYKNFNSVLEDIVYQVITQLNKNESISFIHEGVPIKLLEYLSIKFPYYILILDHCNRLNAILLLQLIQIFNSTNFYKIILVSSAENLLKDSEEIYSWKIPNFNVEEVKELLRIQGFKNLENSHLYTAISGGNPLKLNNILINSMEFTDYSYFSFENLSGEINQTISAVYCAGGYLDEELFCKCFKLNSSTLLLLKNIGLISKINNITLPHDSIHEIVASSNLKLDFQSSRKYWMYQVVQTPFNIFACKQFIISIKVFGYIKSLDSAIKLVLRTLKGKNNISYLIDLAQITINNSIVNKNSIKLCRNLIECGELDYCYYILQLLLKSKNHIIHYEAMVIEMQRLWWAGQFNNTIQLGNSLLSQTNLPIKSLRLEIILNRGIGYFFSGAWNDSIADFKHIIKFCRIKRFLGWAQYLLGTIYAIRGVFFKEGIKLLKKGTQLLVNEGDFIGSCIGYNNIGEVLWKIGNYNEALYNLEKALEIATLLNHKSMQLEILRNTLQVYIRKPENINEIQKLLNLIETDFLLNIENFEKMQILNTIATTNLYFKNILIAEENLKEVFKLTENNAEYHIYTLGNMAILEALKSNMNKALELKKEAFKLAEQGENYLAIKQIEADFSNCNVLI